MISLTLPFPPSANRYWRHAKGRTYRSSEAIAYIEAVQDLVPDEQLEGEISVTMHFHRPARRGDLDNRIKIALDSLRGRAYHDDKQIVRIEATRHEDKKNPRVEITITQEEPTA
jgi:crossover junction endodeoxyribonuclease RusA